VVKVLGGAIVAGYGRVLEIVSRLGPNFLR
jgi:hypothetical protein